MVKSPPESHRPTADPQDPVVVGKVTGPWGIQGDLKVESLTDFSRRFSPGSVLYLEGRPSRVVRARKIKGGLRVHLDLVNDRTHAESLRGALLTVPRDEVPPLPEGSYYHFQIVGIDVWTEGGECLGTVREILPTGGNDVYVVRDADGKEVLLPALEGVVRQVDLEANRMVVSLPEGLI